MLILFTDNFFCFSGVTCIRGATNEIIRVLKKFIGFDHPVIDGYCLLYM